MAGEDSFFTLLCGNLTGLVKLVRFIYVHICARQLHVWLRPCGFNLYAKTFSCNLEEIEIEDLTQYESLGDFFET